MAGLNLAVSRCLGCVGELSRVKFSHREHVEALRVLGKVEVLPKIGFRSTVSAVAEPEASAKARAQSGPTWRFALGLQGVREELEGLGSFPRLIAHASCPSWLREKQRYSNSAAEDVEGHDEALELAFALAQRG